LAGFAASAAVNRENRPKIDRRSGDTIPGWADGDGLDAGFLCLVMHKIWPFCLDR
jgi:hypothetical protein